MDALCGGGNRVNLLISTILPITGNFVEKPVSSGSGGGGVTYHCFCNCCLIASSASHASELFLLHVFTALYNTSQEANRILEVQLSFSNLRFFLNRFLPLLKQQQHHHYSMNIHLHSSSSRSSSISNVGARRRKRKNNWQKRL